MHHLYTPFRIVVFLSFTTSGFCSLIPVLSSHYVNFGDPLCQTFRTPESLPRSLYVCLCIKKKKISNSHQTIYIHKGRWKLGLTSNNPAWNYSSMSTWAIYAQRHSIFRWHLVGLTVPLGKRVVRRLLLPYSSVYIICNQVVARLSRP